MRIANAYYLIIDLEATCSDDGVVPRHEMEIIEIGALMQNSKTFEIESEFSTFIKPVRHPELTTFCNELTGITQNQVDSGLSYADAIDAMKKWMGGFDDALFCSWGDYDRKQFIQDCEYHGVPYPFAAEHLNLKVEFSRSCGNRKPVGIGRAIRSLGFEFEGTQHRGLDDARNIARIVRRECIGV